MALRIRLAEPNDNESLIALARRSPMRGILSLYIDRAPDFFFLNRLQGDPWRVYVAEKNDRIVGSISIAYRTVFVEGNATTIAYISDAKIPPEERGSTVAFRLIRELYEREVPHNPAFFVCSAIRGNEAVINLFKGRAGMPGLEPVGNVDVVNIVPFGKRRPDRLDGVRCATQSDIPAMIGLLNTFHRQYNFAPVFNTEGFLQMLKESKGSAIEDYLLTEDHNGIRAIAARWDQSANKGLVVMKHSLATLSLVGISRVVGLLGLMPKLPGRGSSLKVLQLRHLACRPGCVDDLSGLLYHVAARAAGDGFHVIQLSLAGPDLSHLRLPVGIRVRIPLEVFCGTLGSQTVLEGIRKLPSYEDVSLV